jgi:hypothetical protein
MLPQTPTCPTSLSASARHVPKAHASGLLILDIRERPDETAFARQQQLELWPTGRFNSGLGD